MAVRIHLRVAPSLLATAALAAVLCPAAETVLDESNSWAFELPADPFGDDALLDLRPLNEAKSGQTGFIRKSADGNDFVRGDGAPIRFWAVGTDGHRMTPEEMDLHCRWLAKLGVNLCRLHVTVCVKKEGAAITDVNQEVIDGCHRFVKAAKDNGIYVLISPFYAHFDTPASWGLAGGKQDAEGLIFFNPKLQAAYKEWTRAFYATENPHTGLPIARDPTVAILQIHNEDSLLFWTQQRIQGPQLELLSRRFGAWLTREHGDLARRLEAYGKAREELDDPAKGVAGVMGVWHLTQQASGGRALRIRDQLRFFGELQRSFYADMGAYLRDELGCGQLLNATNWRTANDARLKAVERYSYHALDIDAENEYVGSDFQHKGPNQGYRIDPGDYLVNESVLPKPFEMCSNWTQEEGVPFIVTETAWKNPNRYQSEGPFLVAAYQSLNGVDAVCWFSCQTPRYETDPRKTFWRSGDQFSTHKWNHCYPAMMAGFPANALLYRRGDIRQPEPVVVDVRPMDDVWDRVPPRISDNETYGDQRDPPDLQPGWTAPPGQINRVAYLVGPVRSRLGGDPAASRAADLGRWFDPAKGVIRSVTGELMWNYRKELCAMNTPRAQGVTGFLARNGGRFPLGDVTIESGNDYATVNVVSLDGAPIATSAKVLVQVVTVNRLSGYRTKDATFRVGKGEGAYEVKGEQIERIGEPPFRIANTEVTVTVGNPSLVRATVLDINGYKAAEIPVENGRVTLPKNAIHTILRRE